VLLPSRPLPDGRTEGMPQVALEALAAGVPLLAAATGGLAALPPPVRLLDDREPARWAAALAELLRHPPTPAELRALARPHHWPTVAAALWSHWMS
jgi:glycosyltransferase involved in cell wall biosynthesis